jgi:hypothetical protein
VRVDQRRMDDQMSGVVRGMTTAAGTWTSMGMRGDEERIRETASMGGVRREAERRAGWEGCGGWTWGADGGMGMGEVVHWSSGARRNARRKEIWREHAREGRKMEYSGERHKEPPAVGEDD